MKRIPSYEGENPHSDFSFLEAESEDFFSTEDWDAETPLVLNACGKLNAAFSSEISYDEYFRRAYPWVEHVLVDPPRENFPISATMLRGMTEEEARKWFCK